MSSPYEFRVVRLKSGFLGFVKCAFSSPSGTTLEVESPEGFEYAQEEDVTDVFDTRTGEQIPVFPGMTF